VRAVTVVVHGITGVGYRVDPVDIIDISVVVVIHTITGYLQGILPDVIDQVGVGVVNAGINDYGDL